MYISVLFILQKLQDIERNGLCTVKDDTGYLPFVPMIEDKGMPMHILSHVSCPKAN